MTEEYFVSSFVRGLSDELRSAVKMLKLKTIQEVAKGASLQKLIVETLMKKQRGQNKGGNQGLMQSYGKILGRELLKAGAGVRYQIVPSSTPTLQPRDKHRAEKTSKIVFQMW